MTARLQTTAARRRPAAAQRRLQRVQRRPGPFRQVRALTSLYSRRRSAACRAPQPFDRCCLLSVTTVAGVLCGQTVWMSPQTAEHGMAKTSCTGLPCRSAARRAEASRQPLRQRGQGAVGAGKPLRHRHQRAALHRAVRHVAPDAAEPPQHGAVVDQDQPRPSGAMIRPRPPPGIKLADPKEAPVSRG